MRVLIWTDSYPPYRGGIETASADLAAGLSDRGHDVAVVTSHGDLDLADEAHEDGVSVYRFAFRAALTSGQIREVVQAQARVAALKRRFQPDIVHLQLQAATAFFHIQTQAAHPAPVLLTVHGEFGACEAGPGTLMGRLLGSADWVTGVSAAMLEDARLLAPAITERSSVVYNARPAPAAVQQAFPVEPGMIFCFGRHVRDKGMDLAIGAMPEIVRRCPAARLVIAGDGPERSALATLAASLGVADHVELVGWVPDATLARMRASAAVVLVPSRWREGFGLVALEAQLVARPVVATRVGGLPEVIEDGKTGLLVDPEDPAAIAAAVAALLEDPDRAERLGQAAQAQARQRFDQAMQIDAYEALFRRLSDAHRASLHP